MLSRIKISKFGLFILINFLIFSFLFRLILPFGDEPDFNPRADRVVFNNHPFWSPYNLLSVLTEDLKVKSLCQGDFDITSFWSYIGKNCTENLEQIYFRFIITLLIVSPMLFILIFRKNFILLMKFFRFKKSNEYWNNRLDILAIILIFPSIIYYIGILAEEQFVLFLSLFIFLFFDYILVVFSFLMLIASVDLGNAIVIFGFIIFTKTFLLVNKYLSIKYIILVMALILLFIYFNGSSILYSFKELPIISHKVNEIIKLNMFEESEYLLIFRPFIVLFTSVFMTPSGVKSILINGLYGIVALLFFYRLKLLNIQKKNKNIVIFCSVFFTIFAFTFLFPYYSFAKYYVFMLPFVFSVVIEVFNKKNIIVFLIISNILLVNNILFYHI